MPSGNVRKVLRTATSLSEDGLEFEELKRLPCLSVPLMLHLVELLCAMQEAHKEKEHEPATAKCRPAIAIGPNHEDLAPIISANARADHCRNGKNPESISHTDGGAE